MKIIHYGIWLILLSALQPTLINYIRIFDVMPNLLLIFVVLTALQCGRMTGMTIGAVFGLMFDILLGRMLGIHALFYMYIGFFFGNMSENVLRHASAIISVLAVLLSSFVMGCVEYILRAFTGIGLSFGTAMVRNILPGAVYNALFAILIYFILKKTLKIFSIDKVSD